MESLLDPSDGLRVVVTCYTGGVFPPIIPYPSLVFRANTHILSFGVQSLYHFQFWRSEPSSLLSFGVQSHHHLFDLAFRAIIIPSLAFRAIIVLSFGVQSHHCIFRFRRSEPLSVFRSTFRVIIIISQLRRSEPSLFSVLAFRAIIAF